MTVPQRRSWVGALSGRGAATVDGRGSVTPAGARWRLDWWIGADDRWHDAAVERAVRQHAPGDVPVVETAMRVPGGDAVQRVYGVAGEGDPVVVEIENASPAPFVVALVVDGARTLALEGATAVVDRAWALVASRPPARVAAGRRPDVEGVVRAGAAGDAALGAFRRGDAAALLHPVAHRQTLRFVLAAADRSGAIRPAALAGPDDVRRGWEAWLEQGVRVAVPDEVLAAATRRALTDAVLAGGRPTPELVAALEDWGRDAEATRGWLGLSSRGRRGARRRRPGSAGAVAAALAAGGGPELLVALRALLVQEDPAGRGVTLLAELPTGWRGGAIEVHDVPTAFGPVSYAVRWHEERPALLWEVPPALVVRAPGLDPTWSGTGSSGEALLGPVPASGVGRS